METCIKVAILSINIGKYQMFWKDFYKIAEMNFLPDCDKDYFVFTDINALDVYKSNLNNVHCIYQEDMGWPNNTMKRFHIFNSIRTELNEYSYVFFINANAVFEYKLTKDFILEDKKIVVVEHPGVHGDSKEKLPFERNACSNAYVSFDDGNIYVQGAFFGGRVPAILDMFQTLDDLTEIDLKNNVIAKVHDESFLNKYIIGRSDVQILGWQYLYYEECVFPYIPVIKLRNKRNYIDINALKGFGGNRTCSKILLFLRNLKWRLWIKLKWYSWFDIKDSNGNFLDNSINLVDSR